MHPVQTLLIEWTAPYLKHIQEAQSAHKEAATQCLRECGYFPGKKGYQSSELLIRVIHAVRALDYEIAQEFVKKWKESEQERMNEQLFGDSKNICWFMESEVCTKIEGTDEVTRQMGEAMRDASETIDEWMEALEIVKDEIDIAESAKSYIQSLRMS